MGVKTAAWHLSLLHHAGCSCCQVQLLLTVELLFLAQRGIFEGSVLGTQSAPMTTMQLSFFI